MFNADPNRPTDEILQDIKLASHISLQHRSQAFVFPPMAALLVRLSRDSATAQEQLVADLNRLGDEAKETALQAAKTADKMLVFTKLLFWATIILLVVTILLVGLEFMKFKEPSHGDAKPDQAQQKNSRDINKLPAPTAEQQKGAPQTPEVKAEKQTEGSAENKGKANPPIDKASPILSGSANTANPEGDASHGGEQGTEFWPPLLGIRVKVTDSFLVLFTFVLAIFTGLLWKSTNKLWAAGEKQLVISQRAFVFVSQFHIDIGQVDDEPGWWIKVDWTNSGNTPTRNFFTRINVKTFTDEPGDDFSFPDQPNGDATRALIGPHGIESTAIARVPVGVINGVRDKLRRLFVWGWAEYDDIFENTQPHRTEFCYEVIIDPSGHTIRRLYRRHNGADDECDRKGRPASERTKRII